MILSQTTRFVQATLERILCCGDVAVDATAGNGHDTLFLARRVGEAGRVHAFDVQPAALERTRKRLCAVGLAHRARLHQAGHERMGELLPELRGRVQAVMFNCGYLPGVPETETPEAVITRPESTCAAVDAALALLAPGGAVSLVLYAGHPGGAEETRAVLDHCAALDLDRFHALHCAPMNHREVLARIVFIERKP